MFTKEFWRCSLIRSLKTFAQTFVAMLPAQAMISEVSWGTVLSTSALAAIASIATSLAGLPEVKLEKELENYK